MNPLPDGDTITTEARNYEFGNEELWQYHKANQALTDIAHEDGDAAEARRQEINRRKMVFADRLLPTGTEDVHVYSSDEMKSLCRMKFDVHFYGWAIAQVGLPMNEYHNIHSLAVAYKVKYRSPFRTYVPEPDYIPWA